MIDLSIIVPVFNGEQYLNKCIDNLEKIKGIKYEIVIINDGSTDKTDSIIRNLIKKYNNINYINNKNNKGVSYSRNTGIKEAKGSYIGFADVDDEIQPNMYNKLLNNAKKNNYDISVCNYYEIFPNNDSVTNSKYTYSINHYNNDEVVRNYLIDKISPAIWDKIFKKELISKIEFNAKLSIGEDILFCLNAFSKSNDTCFINDRLYGYLQNDSSVMHTISIKHTQFKKVLEYIDKDLDKRLSTDYAEEYEFFKLQMITRGIHSISSLVNKENKKQAISLLKQYYDKDAFKRIIKNRFFSKSIKLEIFILKTFGIRFHLFLEPIYIKIRNKVR